MLIVQTTRRDAADYLTETIAQVGDVGRRRKMIVSDGPLPDGFVSPEGWEVVVLPKRGARATGWACMQAAFTAGAPDLLLLQDDLEICMDGGAVMDKVVVPANCIAATFYSSFSLPGIQRRAPGEPRLVVVGASGTAQALKLPRRSLEYLCRFDPKSARNIPPLHPHLFDDSLFSIARDSPTPHVANVLPNPVGHVGRISACASTNIHRQQWVVGPTEKFPGDPSNLPVVEVLYR